MGDEQDTPNYTDVATSPGPMAPPQPDQFDQFNANDQMRLDDLNQDWSQVQRDAAVGDLDPRNAQDMFQKMGPERNRLLQKQAATVAQAQQQQQQAALHANAFAQSVGQADAEHRAANFDKTAGRVTDADGTVHTYVPKDWQKVEPKDTEEASGLAEGEPVQGATTDQASGLADHGQPDQSTGARVLPTGGILRRDGSTIYPTRANQQSWQDAMDEVHQDAPRPAGPPVPNQYGGFTQTVMNGSRRTETDFGPGGQAIAQRQYDQKGQLVVPGQEQRRDTIRQQAEAELGRPEPPKYLQGPGGRKVISPEWTHWDTGVRQIDGRMRQQVNEQQRHAAAQVETDYKDAHTNHPLKNYQDSANPNFARTDAIMDDFARQHPDDPRVQQWQQQRASYLDGLKQRDPATMSLPELATAAYGPHHNVQSAVEKQVKAIEAKGDDPVGSGRTFKDEDGNDFDTTPNTVWSKMPHSAVVQEAQKRVRGQLMAAVADSRSALQQAAPQAAPAPQGGQPAAQPAPKVEPLPPEKYSAAEIKAELARRSAAAAPKSGGGDTTYHGGFIH